MIYPDSVEVMRRRGWTDRQLEGVLEIVNLNHIVAREGGWDVSADWKVRTRIILDRNVFDQKKITFVQ